MNNKTVIIVGKPNVGKSSLFNALLKKNLALVSKAPGYTRDLKKKTAIIFDREITLIDSPGIFESDKSIEKKIVSNAISEIDSCDLILLLLDAKEVLNSDDFNIIDKVRKLGKKIIIILNKTEGKFNSDIIVDTKKLGLGTPFLISAAHMNGITQVQEEIFNKLELNKSPEIDDFKLLEKLSLAIVGKTNSGKSTLVNTLKGENVSITGDLPNLTRDAVETFVNKENIDFKIIDTAGFTKDFSAIKNFNKIFMDQTKKKIRLSKIILILMDIDDYFERLHSRIIRLVYDDNRCMILVINKIDKYKNISELLIKEKIYKLNPQIRGLPISFISAKKGVGINSLIRSIKAQNTVWQKRISTGKLNVWLTKLIKKNPPPLYKGRSIKFKYITQANSSPPKFNIFVNLSNAIKLDYRRFIENNLRDSFSLNGLPMKIIYKSSNNPYGGKK
jgi:GTP-binding protein|tara:strand:+ start:5483 stop:6820 length:1338 start_codon:yes stop_codon:yes gene_type:complete